MNCSACTKRVRKTQRALIMTGPGVMKPGKICAQCARLGWLLVMGVDTPAADTARSAGRKAKTARKTMSALTAHILGKS